MTTYTHFEPFENGAAKNVAMDALEKELYSQGVDVYPDNEEDEAIELISLADAVVEALLKAGVVIPEDIVDPHSRFNNQPTLY